jgi:pimeloyl-ACP methyl ester carboxylesterase
MTAVWLLVGVLAAAGLMDLWVRLVYHYPRTPHATTPAAEGIPFSEVRFSTARGRQLYGWWIPAHGAASHPAPPVLILVHGWGRNVERMLAYVRQLHPRGYDLLAFDLRAHGSSDRDGYPNMLMFSEDIRAAVDFVASRGRGPIGVVGLSVGGGAAIHAAAYDDRIDRVVTVGAVAHPVAVMRPEFEKRHVPYFPVVWLTLEYLQLRIGARFDRFAPVNVIGRAKARMLLVHGEEDAVVAVQQARSLARAGDPARVRLWTLPGRGHSDCHEEPGFWTAIDTFLREPMSATPAPGLRGEIT